MLNQLFYSFSKSISHLFIVDLTRFGEKWMLKLMLVFIKIKYLTLYCYEKKDGFR